MMTHLKHLFLEIWIWGHICKSVRVLNLLEATTRLKESMAKQKISKYVCMILHLFS